MLPLLGKLSLETIGIAGFGHSFHALDDDVDEFVLALESHLCVFLIFLLDHFLMNFSPTVARVQHLAPLLPLLMQFIPSTALRRIGEMLPWPTMHQLFNITDIHHHHSACILKELKEAAVCDSAMDNDSGKSLMSRLGSHLIYYIVASASADERVVMANTAASDPTERVPDTEIVAHISTFLLAGTDTTGSTMSRILHLLSENPQIQGRLREELSTAEFNHDTLMGLPFLDAVVKETLRVYVPSMR